MIGEPVTIHTQAVTGENEYGNDVRSSTDTETRGLFAPAGSVELVQGQTLVTSHDTVYLIEPDGLPEIAPTDQITVRGLRRDVEGTPADWRLDGWHPGIVVRLKSVTG